MRQLMVAAVVLAVLGATQARADDKAEIKGPHICCPSCVKAVEGLLAKVDGVSKIKCSVADKSVAFLAKDKMAVVKALEALTAGGFSGTGYFGEATIKLTPVKIEGKGDKVVVKDVHVCCGKCQAAIKGLFADDKVTFTGEGAQREVTITGKDLDHAKVMKALNGKGFSGTIAKK